jgi:hypothetical protein
MTETVPRSTLPGKLIAFAGIAGMIVLGIIEVFTLDVPGVGDRVLHLTYGGVAAGLVATAGAIFWLVRSRTKTGAIIVLVISVLMNPIWLLLLIRLFG